MLVNVTIAGTTALLMNRFPDEDTSAPRSSMRGDKGTPREQAEKKAYVLPSTSTLYLPGPNIYSGLIEAGKFHKIGKRQVTTLKGSLVPAGIYLTTVECILTNPDGNPLTHFEVDSRPVVVPSTGGRIMCHRPRLDEWQTLFTLEIEESEFDPKFVRTLVDDLGKKVGLGDFRPQRKGPFGRFVVKSWEVMKG